MFIYIFFLLPHNFNCLSLETKCVVFKFKHSTFVFFFFSSLTYLFIIIFYTKYYFFLNFCLITIFDGISSTCYYLLYVFFHFLLFFAWKLCVYFVYDNNSSILCFYLVCFHILFYLRFSFIFTHSSRTLLISFKKRNIET